MNQENCPKCGADIKVVPAGISKKTGKPYNEFMACSVWECGWTDKITSKTSPSQPQPATGAYRPTKDAMATRKEMQNTMNYKANQITRFQASKESSMRLFAANRDAVQLTIAEMGQLVLKKEDIKSNIEEWIKYLLENVYMDNEKDFFTKFTRPF